MSVMLTRIFAYFTLVTYLVVGTVAVRFCMPENVTVSFTTSYLNLVSDAPLKLAAIEPVVAPEIHFAEIKIPVEKIAPKIVVKAAPVVTPTMIVKAPEMMMKVLAANELPFYEPIQLMKVYLKQDLRSDLLASYKDFSFSEIAIADTQTVTDEVSTNLAKSENVEPEFFEYPVEEVKKTEPTKTEKITNNEVAVESSEIETQDISDLVEANEASVEKTAANDSVKEPEFFDYAAADVTTQSSAPAVTQVETKAPVVAQTQAVTGPVAGVTFDYAKANAAIANQTMPTVSKVNSQKPNRTINASTINKPVTPVAPVMPEEQNDEGGQGFVPKEDKVVEPVAKKAPAPESFPVSLSILAVGSNLKTTENLQGFEVRFQDDLSETLEDFGAGEVRLETTMAQPKMTRSVAILKRGYVPTSTEIILEEGNGSVSIPLIEDETFNDIQKSFETRKGSIGALLVELDDESELAKLDIPFGDVIKLNSKFQRTENDDFRYQLFVGVQAGNGLISYHRANGEIVSKIVHIHENEITFDANFYEDVVNEKVRLYEEDLLGRENSPLIISGDQVKVFAGNSTAKKVNNHTYKMNFGASHLGGRRYIELNHQSEPVFVGIRDNNNVTVPSENFMRFILSKVEGAKLGNRCLVQVNLTKKAEKFEVASESVGSSLMTYTQVLDADGKFYDTLSEKTQKIIVIGESQASEEVSPDAKVNIKIQYLDGSTQFLNSYCSPNTYLVEQL